MGNGGFLELEFLFQPKEREEKNLKSAEEISYEEKDGQLHFDMSA